MTNIVVAIDGSDHSLMALGWARELARSVPDPVFHLVHSHEVSPPVSEGAAFQYPKLLQQAEARAQDLLQSAAATLAGAPAVFHVLQSPPAAAVLGVAERVGASLIAVGRRGLGRAASLLLGSVSTDIVHHAHVPVLVVHDAKPRPVGRILVGVDGSPHSARALAFAARQTPDAQVTALHVVNIGPEAHAIFPEEDISFDKALERTTRATVAKTAELAGVGPERVIAQGAIGNPAEALLSEYHTARFDLAVVGSRGLGTLSELILGSVSERLLRLAHGPVIVVK